MDDPPYPQSQCHFGRIGDPRYMQPRVDGISYAAVQEFTSIHDRFAEFVERNAGDIAADLNTDRTDRLLSAARKWRDEMREYVKG